MDNMDEHSLAYELLVELKHSAKRWFIAFCVMVVLEIATIIGFMWYISLPAEEYAEYNYEQDADDSSRNLIIQDGDYNGSTSDLP